MKMLLPAALAAILMTVSCSEKPAVSIVPSPVSLELAGENVSVSHDAVPALVKYSIDETLGAEEYELTISRDEIAVKAGSEAGVFYAKGTLDQIIAQSPDNVLPCLTVKDKPQFAYRGAHLDCCRHFWTVDEIKTWIDMIAMHKINVFHWHLTEDQGWRIEIKKYPLLTEYGSIRKKTIAGHLFNSTGYDETPYGGFYTQEQVKEVVAYAAERFITVVPEIEMPGHAVAALACYPELGCTGGPYEVWPDWGVSEDVFCIGKEATFEFLENVLDEVCELFPSEYIHIGGDEAPRVRWENCPDCQKRMKEEGLESEAQLQSYLVARIEKYLNAKGKKIIGWDEILEGGVTPTATVMSWRGPEGGIAAAKQGNNVIMAPNSNFYFDYYQTQDPEKNGEPLGIGGHLNLEKCYSFDPFDQLDENTKNHIWGIQANTWTEYITTFDHVMWMDLPRMAALAEVAWSAERTSYQNFVDRVQTALLPLYEERGYNYAPFAFEGID